MTRSPDREWHIGPDGRVLRVSEVWLETIGRHAIDAPGYCWLDYVDEADRERVARELAAHRAARRTFVITFRALHHSRRLVTLRTGGVPLADGGYVGWTWVARQDRRIAGVPAKAACAALTVG